MIRLILILNFLFLFAKLSQSQGLEFYREDLTFFLKTSSFEVDGIYFFCNTSSDTLNQLLFYPFPKGDGYRGYQSISVYDLDKKNDIAFKPKRDSSGVYFSIIIAPYKTAKYKISYSQILTGNTAEYILMTTHAWNKPFEIVNYELISYSNLEVDFLSIEPDTIFKDPLGTRYIWQKRDFMPDCNMLIKFVKWE